MSLECEGSRSSESERTGPTHPRSTGAGGLSEADAAAQTTSTMRPTIVGRETSTTGDPFPGRVRPWSLE